MSGLLKIVSGLLHNYNKDNLDLAEACKFPHSPIMDWLQLAHQMNCQPGAI